MYQYLGEQTDPKNIGTIEFNTEHDAPKRPLWLVLLRVVCGVRGALVQAASRIRNTCT